MTCVNLLIVSEDRFAKISAFIGIGLVLVGGVMLWQQRRATTSFNGLGRPRYRRVEGMAEEAPVIDGFSDGNMHTEIRASDEMPIEQRLATIQRKIYEGTKDPEMRKLALAITSQCPERDGLCEAKAIYKAVKKRVRYSGDIAPIKHPNGQVEGIDLYQSARRTWEFKAGDCDDTAILISTLLAHNGITPRLRVTAEDKHSDDGHIYVIALLPKFNPSYSVALDATLPGNKFNVEAPAARVTDFDA